MPAILLHTTIIAAIITSIAAWGTNLVWTFQQDSVSSVLLGALGVFVPFVGVFHGLTLWL